MPLEHAVLPLSHSVSDLVHMHLCSIARMFAVHQNHLERHNEIPLYTIVEMDHQDVDIVLGAIHRVHHVVHFSVLPHVLNMQVDVWAHLAVVVRFSEVAEMQH